MSEKTPPEEQKPELDEPVLLENSYIKEQKSPPWVLIGFVIFAVLVVFWKKALNKDAPPPPPIEAPKLTTEEKRASEQILRNLQKMQKKTGAQ